MFHNDHQEFVSNFWTGSHVIFHSFFQLFNDIQGISKQIHRHYFNNLDQQYILSMFHLKLRFFLTVFIDFFFLAVFKDL